VRLSKSESKVSKRFRCEKGVTILSFIFKCILELNHTLVWFGLVDYLKEEH